MFAGSENGSNASTQILILGHSFDCILCFRVLLFATFISLSCNLSSSQAKWLSAIVAVKKLRAPSSSLSTQEVNAIATDYRCVWCIIVCVYLCTLVRAQVSPRVFFGVLMPSHLVLACAIVSSVVPDGKWSSSCTFDTPIFCPFMGQ